MFLAWQREARTVARLAAYRPWGFVLTGSGEPERLTGARVSADLFPLLGITPILGRTFTPDDDVLGRPRVAVVSEGLWERRLGSERDLARRSLVLNGVAHAVVGVLPRGFSLPAADVWVPLALEPFALTQPGNRALTVVGRLAEGSSPAEASAEVNAIVQRLTGPATGADAGWGAGAVSLTDHLVGQTRPTLLIAWGAVGLVLLIACANTASLMLARAAARRQEIAICRALGAPRSRLVARVLGESLVLAGAGGLLGLPLAAGLLKIVVTLAPPELPRLDGVGIDVPLLVFTGGLSVATALLFGSLPAARSSRADLSGDLRAGSRGAVGGAPHATLRHLAVSCQVALTIVVLVGAGLLLRSLARVLSIEPGFRVDRVLTMTVSLPDAKYRRPATARGVLPAAPGADPRSGRRRGRRVREPRSPGGRPVDGGCGDGEPDGSRKQQRGRGDWFGALRIPLVRGRGFTDRDGPGTPAVVMINARMAARLWPNADPIGRRLVVGGTLGADRTQREIVGIVGERARDAGDCAARSGLPPVRAESVAHDGSHGPDGGRSSRGRRLRCDRAVYAIDADQVVYNLRPFESIVARAIASRRFQVFLLSLFAAIALVLAATGVYSVVSYGVRQRRQEVGVRLALGARKADVLLLAVRDSLRWAAAGLAAGGILAFFASRALAGVLYESPYGPGHVHRRGRRRHGRRPARIRPRRTQRDDLDPLAVLRDP